jgi:hypothetical protein
MQTEQRKRDAGLIHPYAVDLADREVTFDLRAMGVNSTKDSRLDEFRNFRASETNRQNVRETYLKTIIN